MNAHLLASNMDSLCDMDNWEVPVSEILDYTYKLVSTITITEGVATDSHIVDRHHGL